jgi:uncharacterized OsmC-like protein
VPARHDRLVTEAVGEVEDEAGVLVLRRIRVTYRLRLGPGADRDKVQRAFEHHTAKCPVYRSISDAVAIETFLEVVDA